jgi:hypothetical protein
MTNDHHICDRPMIDIIMEVESEFGDATIDARSRLNSLLTQSQNKTIGILNSSGTPDNDPFGVELSAGTEESTFT